MKSRVAEDYNRGVEHNEIDQGKIDSRSIRKYNFRFKFGCEGEHGKTDW